jgi:hypothetical protein
VPGSRLSPAQGAEAVRAAPTWETRCPIPCPHPTPAAQGFWARGLPPWGGTTRSCWFCLQNLFPLPAPLLVPFTSCHTPHDQPAPWWLLYIALTYQLSLKPSFPIFGILPFPALPLHVRDFCLLQSLSESSRKLLFILQYPFQMFPPPHGFPWCLGQGS